MKTTTMPFEATLQVACQTMVDANTPRSIAMYELTQTYLVDSYNPTAFVQAVDELGFDVNWYLENEIGLLSKDYLVTNLLSKLPPKPGVPSDLSDQALLGFKKAEERNAVINSNWSPATDFPVAFKQLEDLGVPIDVIRDTVRSIVGRAPSLKVLNDELAWTTGASAGISSAYASAETKAEFGVTITPELASVLNKRDFVLNPLISAKPWCLIQGNLVTTVRKNIKTDRTIAEEADINGIFQRAIGKKLRRCLLRHGIDLRDQTSNQRACIQAYLRRLATLDLKDASYGVLYLPVMQVFPEDWGTLFDCTRSHKGTFSARKDAICQPSNADWFEYQMLSSMGNGYTFELESILFFAICRACGVPQDLVWVYGDDIIIPQSFVPLVTSVLGVFGLLVNTVKSFTEGTFFESCGVYSFAGADVTPFKIKDLLNEDKDCITLANKVRDYAHLYNNLDGCAKWCLPTWQMCVSRLRPHVRKQCRGPRGLGQFLFMNKNEANVTYSRKRGALLCHQLVPDLREYHAEWHGLMVVRLSQIGNSLKSHEGNRVLTPEQFFKNSWESRKLDRLIGTPHGNCFKKEVRRWVVKPIFCETSWYDYGWWKD